MAKLELELVGAGAHGFDDGLDRPLRGLDDHRDVTAHAHHALEKFKPVHARHQEIENDELDLGASGARQNIQTLGSAFDACRLEAEPLHHFFQYAPLGGIVFNNKDARCHA